MDKSEIKRKIIRLIGSAIDEASLNIGDLGSFVEMAEGVIHCVIEGEPVYYFRITLTETTEDEYFELYKPD